jgi:tRNA(Ile)-lysidine synthase
VEPEQSSVVEQVRASVRAGGLLEPAGPLVAMLSGGRDSVCLLDVAVALCGAESVCALHVNYGLRDAADADERHCAALCDSLGIELHVEHAGDGSERPGVAEGQGGNLQAWARELRYSAAERLARGLDRRGERTLIATGHTASDQVETILYRLAASPGRRALLGMASAEGRLVRPLLGIDREQTADYCRARRLDWREDESNQDERFARARVRARVVPALRAVHPAAEANVLRTARLLREEKQLLDALVDHELAGAMEIELARLQALAPALARLVVIRLAEQAAGGYVPQAGERVQELLALGRRGGRAELHVGGQAGAVIEGGRLSMRRLPPREQPPDGD